MIRVARPKSDKITKAALALSARPSDPEAPLATQRHPATLNAAITAAVRALYEAYPYPHYPLLATPRWQDGYLTHSAFTATLTADLRGGKTVAILATAPRATILIGGGGEILPYVIRKWEPSAHRVISVDLSAHSLRRARWRCFWQPRRTSFARADLDAYLQAQVGQGFAHIDVYGVLHHMPNPSSTLTLIRARLAAGGTARLMVYNGDARRWIRHLQRLFAVLEVDRFAANDVNAAKHLLALAGAASPALAGRLRQLGPGTLTNPARFADTFLHPREARLGVGEWLDAIARAGLTVVGLLDRYGELDDLVNPLWQAPDAADLAARARDGRFEHNLELFITVPGDRASLALCRQGGRLWFLPYLFKGPPTMWFSYDETRTLSFALKLKLWRAHLAWVLRRDRRDMPQVLAALPTAAAQRLVRIGAILPGQIAEPGRCAALARPMASAEPAAMMPTASPLTCPKLHAQVWQMLEAKGRLSRATSLPPWGDCSGLRFSHLFAALWAPESEAQGADFGCVRS